MKSIYQILVEVGAGKIDVADLLVRIAEENPKLVERVANGVNSIEKEVQKIYSQNNILGGGYVSAIKFYRQSTGTGLKEAKDAVDKITGHQSRYN